MTSQQLSNSYLETLNPKFVAFIKKIFSRSSAAFIIIFGRRETGKTDMALLLAHIAYELGLVRFIASNIKVLDSPFPIQYIDNLDDLRFWSKDNYGRKLFLFDEYGKALRRRSPMSNLNIELIDDLQTLRKDKLSTIACTINEKYVDNASLGDDILDGVFNKPDYKNKKFAIYKDLLEGYVKRIRNIPATKIKFDEWGKGKFKRHAKLKVPKFKEYDMELLWKWSHGELQNMEPAVRQRVSRARKKFIKETLEKQSDT